MITLPNPHSPEPGHNQPLPHEEGNPNDPKAQSSKKGLIIVIALVAFIAILVLIASIVLSMKFSINTQKFSYERPTISSSEHTDPVPNPVPGESPEDVESDPTPQDPTPDSKTFPLKYTITIEGNPADITYTDKDFEVKTIKDVTGSWSMTVPFKDESQQDTAGVSVSQYGHGTISCKIIKDREVVSEYELEGSYSSLSCKQKQEPVYSTPKENSDDS